MVSDIDEEQSHVLAEACDSVGGRKRLSSLQHNRVDESHGGWPIASMLCVGDDLINVTSIDPD